MLRSKQQAAAVTCRAGLGHRGLLSDTTRCLLSDTTRPSAAHPHTHPPPTHHPHTHPYALMIRRPQRQAAADAVNDITFGEAAANEALEDAVNDTTFGEAAAFEAAEDAVNDITIGEAAANEALEDAVNDTTFGAEGGAFEAPADAVNDVTFGEDVRGAREPKNQAETGPAAAREPENQAETGPAAASAQASSRPSPLLGQHWSMPRCVAALCVQHVPTCSGVGESDHSHEQPIAQRASVAAAVGAFLSERFSHGPSYPSSGSSR